MFNKYYNSLLAVWNAEDAFTLAKTRAFEEYRPSLEQRNLYIFDEATKTAYVCFDEFEVNYDDWDNYYSNGMNEEDIPTTGDTFIFVRNCFYQALEDGAENVILDLSTNYGGETHALCGIVGLINGSTCDFTMNDVFNDVRMTESCGVDINLDGVWDEKDVAESAKFTFNVGVLTTVSSFSCGNLLPSMLKELGCKIIGQRSGGGSCAISYSSTADGVPFYHSNTFCLFNSEGENIDGGVETDFEIISENGFYDFVTIANYYASLTEVTP